MFRLIELLHQSPLPADAVVSRYALRHAARRAVDYASDDADIVYAAPFIAYLSMMPMSLR